MADVTQIGQFHQPSGILEAFHQDIFHKDIFWLQFSVLKHLQWSFLKGAIRPQSETAGLSAQIPFLHTPFETPSSLGLFVWHSLFGWYPWEELNGAQATFLVWEVPSIQEAGNHNNTETPAYQILFGFSSWMGRWQLSNSFTWNKLSTSLKMAHPLLSLWIIEEKFFNDHWSHFSKEEGFLKNKNKKEVVWNGL